jgi:hypothetical protein
MGAGADPGASGNQRAAGMCRRKATVAPWNGYPESVKILIDQVCRAAQGSPAILAAVGLACNCCKRMNARKTREPPFRFPVLIQTDMVLIKTYRQGTDHRNG